MNKKHILQCALWSAVCVVFIAFPALAQIEYPPEYADNCSYNPAYNISLPAAGTGIISLLVSNISSIIGNVAALLYNTILGNASFQLAVRASMTLFVAIYGILIAMGLAHITWVDFTIRVLKLSIIATLISPNSWAFFNTYVVTFFHGGTNWLISVMSSIAVGMVSGVDPQHPFAVLDNAIAVITSSRLFVTLIATFFTGPFGLFIGMLIIASLGTFAAALFQAMWVYLMSLVVRAFLFALAPMFFAFLLFSRTRHLFDGWLNALISSMLQPVFLFAFFAFFAKLVEASLYNLLRVPVCWVPMGKTWQGSTVDLSGWRFMVPRDHNGVMRWGLYIDEWTFTGPKIAGASVFPLSLIDVVTFLMLVYLMYQFIGVALHVASSIAGASLALNVSGAMSNLMSPTTSRMEALQKTAGYTGKLQDAVKSGDTNMAKEMQDRLRKFVEPRGGGPGGSV